MKSIFHKYMKLCQRIKQKLNLKLPIIFANCLFNITKRINQYLFDFNISSTISAIVTLLSSISIAVFVRCKTPSRTK